MLFSVQELEQRKIRFEVTYPSGEIEYLVNDLHQTGPLEAQGEAELLPNTLGEIRVRGHVKVVMEADCDRCLEKAAFPIDSDFDLFYRPEKKPDHPGEEAAIDAGESEIGFYKGAGLQLEDILREHILLAMPMQRVCSETCQGICPVCGQNRNIAPCDCHPVIGDDQWAALRRLQS